MAETIDFTDGVVTEPECVLVDDLAPILETWLARERRKYEQETGTRDGRELTGPMGYLAFTAKIPIRRINGILNREQVSITLDIADRLLLAMDHHIWEVPVYSAKEVRDAALMQKDLIALLAQASGKYIDRSNRNWPTLQRRHLHLIQGGKA